MSEQSRPSYEFGPFLLDANKRLLLRDGEPVPLAPKVLETLLVLIENRERVLTKDELLKQVWGDTVVEEGGSPGTSPSCGRRWGRSPTTISTSSRCPPAAIGSWRTCGKRRGTAGVERSRDLRSYPNNTQLNA